MTHIQEISKTSAFSGEKTTEEKPSRLSSIIFVLLCAILVLSVVFYGAVDTIWLAILTAVAAFIVLFWLADAWKTAQFKYNSSALQIPLLALILIGLVQLLPLGNFVAPGDSLSVESVSSLSLNPFMTRLAVIRLCVDFVFFAALLTFVNHRGRLKKLILTIIIFSSIMAFYGILQRLASLEGIYGVRPTPQANPFASFVNQHHFAAFMEMTIGLTLGILFGKGVKKEMRIFLIIAALIMGIAIIFTGSRGGLLSFLAVLGFIVFANVLWDRQKADDERETDIRISRFRRNLILVGGGLVLVVVLFGSVILLGGDNALLRGIGLNINQADVSSGRTHFWSVALNIFSDYPVLGAGLDAFGTAFSRYDSWNGLLRVEHAHNDYLQILADAGIIGLICVIAFIFLLFKQSLKTIGNTSDHFRRNAAIGALAGCFGIIVHSFFDFPLRTPSNAFYFLAMAALATVSVYYPKLHRKRK